MRIGIDARMLGPNVGGGGLGRYVEELVRELTQLDHKNRYVLFLKKQGQRGSRASMASTIEERYVPVHWYTFKEQLVMPRLIDREKLNLIHFPHWNVPLLLRTPFVVTIHDLILLEEPRSATVTTRHPIVFLLKRMGYRIVLAHALKRARAIIAVSHFTKSSILKHFPRIPEQKIHVVYEGLTRFSDPSLPPSPPPLPKPPTPPPPSLLYVGNAYPHKNLEALLQAFLLFHTRHPEFHLVLAGRDDTFYQRLKSRIATLPLPGDAVKLVLNPSDTDLATLYRQATLYVFPSRHEGFGLPPLEAMSVGLPVAAARQTSLPEILGDAAAWFDPNDIQNMADVMGMAVEDRHLRTTLVERGYERVKRYSWTAMARDILKLYESCAP